MQMLISSRKCMGQGQLKFQIAAQIITCKSAKVRFKIKFIKRKSSKKVINFAHFMSGILQMMMWLLFVVYFHVYRFFVEMGGECLVV